MQLESDFEDNQITLDNGDTDDGLSSGINLRGLEYEAANIPSSTMQPGAATMLFDFLLVKGVTILPLMFVVLVLLIR